MEADFRGCAYFSWLDSIIGVSRLTTASTQPLTEHFNNAMFFLNIWQFTDYLFFIDLKYRFARAFVDKFTKTEDKILFG